MAYRFYPCCPDPEEKACIHCMNKYLNPDHDHLLEEEMGTNSYTILESEQYRDAVEVIFWHSRSDYKAHVRIAKMDGVDGGVSIHDLTTTNNAGLKGTAFIPPSILIEAMEILECMVPEDSYYRACHKASGNTMNQCRAVHNMCENCPQKERTNHLPFTLFDSHKRIEELEALLGLKNDDHRSLDHTQLDEKLKLAEEAVQRTINEAGAVEIQLIALRNEMHNE